MNMKSIHLFKPLGFSPLSFSPLLLRSLHCSVIRPVGNNIIASSSPLFQYCFSDKTKYKVNIATIRCFSSSPSLKTDEDLLTRLNNLIETSKNLVDEGKKYTDNKEYKNFFSCVNNYTRKQLKNKFLLKLILV